ncbi:hypothetical protein UFOVP219_16 [uncultured Caudovirales phage]|uniref:Uncharacterized protein n=1 Tax=uncultured Caudovirales phage TaxID=2100421 RepID=A0A6J7WL15_9CAUD|nr:hypothetical protein UFOVP219_16 [uncultured Caudovirales phage]
MIHINEIQKNTFTNYCEICGNWANEACDCCVECLAVADECECE